MTCLLQGRIIIRDGIMTEPEDAWRRIRFLEADGIEWLIRYASDFKGRVISYERLAEAEVRIPVNDAMEFLYTYTWGLKLTFMKCKSSLATLRLRSMRNVYAGR